MSERPLLARLAADLLAEGANEVKVRGPSEAERARAIAVAAAAIAKAAAARKQAARRRVGVGVGLAIAAAVSGLVVVKLRTAPVMAPGAAVPTTTVHAHALVGEPTLWRLGMSEPLRGAVTLVPGDRVRATAGASAQLQMSTGSKVAVEEGGDLTLVGVQNADVLALSAGAARFEVAKVTAGRKFLVRTGDAEIEVRGTAFRVSVVPVDPTCAVATPTRVEVTEGRVVVRYHGEEAVLVAGGAWPSGCSTMAKKVDAPAPTLSPLGTLSPPGMPAIVVPTVAPKPMGALVAPALVAPTMVPPPAGPATTGPATTGLATTGPATTGPATTGPATTGAATTGPATTGPPPVVAVAPKKASDLASQNDLFTFGLEKKKAGDFGAARAAFDRYLTLYPQGALAESATVEKMRLSSGSARKELAQTYLARWPKGFARAEAQAIVGD